MTRAAAFVLAVTLLAGVQPASAQQSVLATAELVVAAPTGNGTRNLSFGTVFPNAAGPVQVAVPAARNPLNASQYAGEFRFNIATVRGLEFSVSTPTQLTAASYPALTLDTNGTQYGGYCTTVNGSACTITAFNPNSATPIRVCHTFVGGGTCHPNRTFSSGSELSVYIGGMLTVPQTAMPALYTGTITLTIVQVY